MTPGTVACQALLSLGFSRQEYWSELPFPPPGDLSNPGIEARSPALQADSLPSDHQSLILWAWCEVFSNLKSAVVEHWHHRNRQTLIKICILCSRKLIVTHLAPSWCPSATSQVGLSVSSPFQVLFVLYSQNRNHNSYPKSHFFLSENSEWESGFPVGSDGKKSTCHAGHLGSIPDSWVQSLGQEDLLEKGMATHSSILAQGIPWIEEPGGLQSMGLQKS